MLIPFDRDGITLPVCDELLCLVDDVAQQAPLALAHSTAITFNFRDPDYDSQRGGFHPVEIRLVQGLNGWLFDYVTDFSYQGLGQDAELCKELDFNFLDREYFMLGWGALRHQHACEIFSLWQRNFLHYQKMGCFAVTAQSE